MALRACFQHAHGNLQLVEQITCGQTVYGNLTTTSGLSANQLLSIGNGNDSAVQAG